MTDSLLAASPGSATLSRAQLEASYLRQIIPAVKRFLIETSSAALAAYGLPTTTGEFTSGFVISAWVEAVLGMGWPTLIDPDVLLVEQAYATARAVMVDSAERHLDAHATARAMETAMDYETGAYLVKSDNPRSVTAALEPDPGTMIWAALAALIARTRATRDYNSQALVEITEEAHEADPTTVGTKQWVSHHDHRVRATHLQADGQIQPLTLPFMVGGYTLEYPGDPQGPEHEVINCRCVVVAGGSTFAFTEINPPIELTAGGPGSGRYPKGSGGLKGDHSPLDSGAADDNGVPYSAEVVALANAVHAKAVEHNGEITRDMQSFVAPGAHLEGLPNRVKNPASLARKIKADSINKKLTPEDAAARVYDAVRFTQISPAAQMAADANATLDGLRASGYEVRQIKNTWGNTDNNPYQGVNVKLIHPSGQKIELQFHTPESFEMKGPGLHELYDDQKDEMPGSLKWNELNKAMLARSAGLEVPPDVHGIR